MDIPVVEDGELVGMFTVDDVARRGCYATSADAPLPSDVAPPAEDLGTGRTKDGGLASRTEPRPGVQGRGG